MDMDNEEKIVHGVAGCIAFLCCLALEYLLAPMLLCYAWNNALVVMWPTLPIMTFKVAFQLKIGFVALRAALKIDTGSKH